MWDELSDVKELESKCGCLMVGQWKYSAFSIYSAASAVRLTMFQYWNMSGIEGWAKVMRNERQWCLRKIGMVLPLRMSETILENKKMLITGKEQNSEQPSISQEDYGFPRTTLRQRKCWVWGFMLQNNTGLFSLINPEPPLELNKGWLLPLSRIGWRMSHSGCCTTGMKCHSLA